MIIVFIKTCMLTYLLHNTKNTNYVDTKKHNSHTQTKQELINICYTKVLIITLRLGSDGNINRLGQCLFQTRCNLTILLIRHLK